MKYFTAFSASILSFISISLFGQEVVSTSGNYFSNDNISISWTLGEPVIETIGDNNLILTQGMQQSKLVVTAIDELSNLSGIIKAYPNPASDHVNINIENIRADNIEYSLFNMEGRLITTSKITRSLTSVSLKNCSPATYLLKVSNSENILKTFKIVKTE